MHSLGKVRNTVGTIKLRRMTKCLALYTGYRLRARFKRHRKDWYLSGAKWMNEWMRIKNHLGGGCCIAWYCEWMEERMIFCLGFGYSSWRVARFSFYWYQSDIPSIHTTFKDVLDKKISNSFDMMEGHWKKTSFEIDLNQTEAKAVLQSELNPFIPCSTCFFFQAGLWCFLNII